VSFSREISTAASYDLEFFLKVDVSRWIEWNVEKEINKNEKHEVDRDVDVEREKSKESETQCPLFILFCVYKPYLI
jgi:hypothetical protein